MLPFKKRELSLWISAMLVSGAVMAVETEQKEDEQKKVQSIERITVTGTGRPKMASEIPMNITAMTEAELRENNIANLKDLIADSVEIHAPDNSARFADSVSVRGLNVAGVNANNLQQFIRTTMAYYLDATPLPNINYRIKDVARVEQLIGPQGTLYGAGSLGGTIRYITNEPVLEEFQFDLNTNFYQTQGGRISNDTDVVFNIPMGERFAARLSLARLDEKGFTDRQVNPSWVAPGEGFPGNPNPNQTLYKRDDWQEVTGGRLTLLWQVSDDLRLKYSRTQQDQLAHGIRGASRLPVNRACEGIEDCTFTSFDTPFQYNDRTVVSRFAEFADRDLKMDSIDVDWDLGFATLTSSTANYRDSSVGQADYAGAGNSFYGWIPGLALADGNDSAYMTFDNSYRGISHESRLTPSIEGPWSWIVGVYHTNQRRNYKFSEWFERLDEIASQVSWLGFDRATAGGNVGEGYREDLGSKYKETAIFGEVGYDITEKWNLTVGARVFNYTDIGSGFIRDYLGPTDSDRDFKGSGSGESFFKFNTAYFFSDEILGYFTYSQGFRRGGTNSFREDSGRPVAEDAQFYEPDSTDNYELGVKGFLADGFFVQANVYQIQWNNVQTYFSQTIEDFFPVNGTTNGPDAKTRGAELSMRYYLTDNLLLTYSTATTKGTWDETVTKCVYEESVENNECRTWMKGGSLGGNPKWRHNFGVRYTADLDNGMSLWGSLNGRYVGKVQNDRQDNPEAAIFEYPSFTTFSANLGLGKDNWDVRLWATNLTNSDAIVSNQNSGILGRRTIALTPRTIGLSFSYSYF